MRRFKSSGLCLVAVLALTAVMASAAQAGQIGRCVKARQGTRKFHGGEYTDPYCATKASPAKTGKYEWEANNATIPFASDGGSSHWKVAAGEELRCEGLADKGQYLPGGVKDTDTLTFTDCSLDPPFEQLCKSYGAAGGEIKTNELASTFIDHGEKGLSGKEPASGEVWEQETAAGTSTDPAFGVGSWLASFECEGIPFALSGSISGVVEAAYVNARLKAGRAGKRGKLGKATFKEAFTEQGGEQDLQTTFVNPFQGDAVESGPAVLEFTNDVIISPLEKGLEISGAA